MSQSHKVPNFLNWSCRERELASKNVTMCKTWPNNVLRLHRCILLTFQLVHSLPPTCTRLKKRSKVLMSFRTSCFWSTLSLLCFVKHQMWVPSFSATPSSLQIYSLLSLYCCHIIHAHNPMTLLGLPDGDSLSTKFSDVHSCGKTWEWPGSTSTNKLKVPFLNIARESVLNWFRHLGS